MLDGKMKFMALAAKIIGNPSMLEKDCSFKILVSEMGRIEGTFEVRGELAKELGEFLGKQNG